MDSGDADEPSREELANRVEQLEETVSKMLPSRRGVVAAGAGVGLGALLSGSASGQSAAGQVGTSSDPVDVEAYDVTVANLLNGGGPLSDGDGTERQVWVIANGAADPAGADPEDLIFEEES